MAVTATVTWVLAVLFGLRLLFGWLAQGGLRRQPTKVTRFPAAVVLAHPACALAGFGLWIAYLTTARSAYAWGAFGVLVVVALLGFTLLTRWLVGRGGRHARGAQQSFPTVTVVAHGVVGVLTFTLVFVTALTLARR